MAAERRAWSLVLAVIPGVCACVSANDMGYAASRGLDEGGAASDAGDASSPTDAAADRGSPVEASTETGAPDGGPGPVDSGGNEDTGCGPIDTVASCGACGRACSTTQASSTSCNGQSCLPTCNAGYLSCNNPAAPAPDDGCECAVPNAASVPKCCATACPIAHTYDATKGAAATFYDCVAQGTYNAQVAMDACLAYAGAGQCNVAGTYHCVGPDGGGNTADLVCSDGTGAPACTCFGYDNAVQGLFHVGAGTGAKNCDCPLSTDPHWN
jgi:hypothetical protein